MTGRRLSRALVAGGLWAGVFALYALTAAPGTLFGDPAEYQFIPAILGIAHPPGYAFYTLLAKVWQTVVPIGTIAFRTNLLAAAVGAWAVTAVYLAAAELAPGWLPLLFAALSLAAAPDFWQHAIHANAHIVSGGLAATHLWLLLRWQRTADDRYLTAFAVMLGLAATHHPITLMGLPAYGIFLLAVRPPLLRQWQRLLWPAGGFLLGLTPLLYYPLRSPSAPFGPTDMRTWAGFWRHVTAQGLRVNLFHFGWADQWDRAVVFWSLLRLQFPILTIGFIVAGAIYLARRAPRPALLLGTFVAAHLLFTLNTVQDVMAYLLLPFAALSVVAGMGVQALVERFTVRRLAPAVCSLVLLLPTLRGAADLRQGVALRDFTAADEWVADLEAHFGGQGRGAVLLSDWEHLTPLRVHLYTAGEHLAPEDVRAIYIPTSDRWADGVWQHIEEGPLYLPDYRFEVRKMGFRLVPEGRFYRVVAPPVTDAVPQHPLDVWAADRVRVLGFDLPAAVVHAGEPLELRLYQTAPEGVDGVWMPYGQLGPVEARWTTDSRLLSTDWQPGEVVVERFWLPVPFTLPPGEYPLRLGYADLTGGRPALPLSTGGETVELATVTVLPPTAHAPFPAAFLANLDEQILLLDARARVGWERRRAVWQEPLGVRAGEPLHLTLTWMAVTKPRDSYTVFIHLIDGAGRYVTGHDYTPLGGACPTYLWFPKWLPGQRLTDPYRLVIPETVPPGDYWLEVGMYGMTSLQRLPVVDLAGNLSGDRVVLGPVRVE